MFVILFACATAYHSFLLFKHRLWFCLPFVIGGFCNHPQFSLQAAQIYSVCQYRKANH